MNVLIVDDNAAIHADFAKILRSARSTAALDDLARLSFGVPSPSANPPSIAYNLDFAFQGAEALDKVRKAVQAGEHYALAFVDMRMPPGWDGLQTIEHLWSVDPELQVVICSAYSYYDWDEILARLNRSDNLFIFSFGF